jgi:bacterioferritin-associated ferredoxin
VPEGAELRVILGRAVLRRRSSGARVGGGAWAEIVKEGDMGKMRNFVEMVAEDGCPKDMEHRISCHSDCLKCYIEHAKKLVAETAEQPEESREINTEGKPLVETARADLHLLAPKRPRLRKRLKKLLKRWDQMRFLDYEGAIVLDRCTDDLKRELDVD